MKAVVSNIERLATYDGPGLRTVIYFKGCPLRCAWCSNPETQHIKPEILIDHHSCISCLNCVKSCPQDAISYDNKIIINKLKCNNCNECLSVCPTRSLKNNGETYTLDEIIKQVLKDEVYYKKSGGGVTVSGGEMLMHGDFVIEFFKKLQSLGINTAIETSGYGDSQRLEEIIKYTDYIMYDYKASSENHKKYTGKENELIKSNLQMIIDSKHQNVLVRIPLIPTVNTSEEQISKIKEELKTIKVKTIEFLPYHEFGKSKYDKLNVEYKLMDVKKVQQDELDKIIDLFRKDDFEVILRQ